MRRSARKLTRPAPRHYTTTRDVVNTLTPKPGMLVIANVDRADIGSGYRVLLIVIVGRKFITMLYTPTLTTVKISLKEWQYMRFEKVSNFNMPHFITSIHHKRAMMDEYGLSYRTDTVDKAEALFAA